MGPSLGFNNNTLVSLSEKGYYDTSNPGSCESSSEVETRVNDMSAHNLVVRDKTRLNEKSPLAYYDPTENMDRSIIESLKNSDLYVVPIDIQDDLRDEDNKHLFMKENLKKTTKSFKTREKYYYDPTVDSYINHVQTDSQMKSDLNRNETQP